jgi:hypothetical protein
VAGRGGCRPGRRWRCSAPDRHRHGRDRARPGPGRRPWGEGRIPGRTRQARGRRARVVPVDVAGVARSGRGPPPGPVRRHPLVVPRRNGRGRRRACDAGLVPPCGCRPRPRRARVPSAPGRRIRLHRPWKPQLHLVRDPRRRAKSPRGRGTGRRARHPRLLRRPRHPAGRRGGPVPRPRSVRAGQRPRHQWGPRPGRSGSGGKRQDHRDGHPREGLAWWWRAGHRA